MALKWDFTVLDVSASPMPTNITAMIYRQTIREVRGDMKTFTFAAFVDTLTDLIH